MADTAKTIIGLWSEMAPGSRWANEGVSRVFGFIIEGAAQYQDVGFRIVVQRGLKDAVEQDLRTLSAVEGRDWTVESPPEGYAETEPDIEGMDIAGAIRGMAHFANRHVDVEGWLILFPQYTGSLLLKRPKVVHLPDALAFDFPIGWDPVEHWWGANGEFVQWLSMVRPVFDTAAVVFTHSRHNATRHGRGYLDIAAEKLRVIPIAPPDVGQYLLLPSDAIDDWEQSRRHAADVLREHARERGWSYLEDFPFEDVPFAVVSTQDRPTKNIGVAAQALMELVRHGGEDLKIFTTAALNYGETWTLLPGAVERHQLHFDIISMRDLPRGVHAALFHCATLTIHPSLFEGIIGCLPFYESLSVGTPCVMARGPHVEELLEAAPELEPYVFDGYNVRELAQKVRWVLSNRRSALDEQRSAWSRLTRRSWADVARECAAAVLTPQE